MPVKLPPSDPEKDPLQPQWRAYFVTINSCSSDIKLAKPLKAVWEYIIKNLSQFVIGRSGSHMLEVRDDHKLERGVKFHKIHLHSNLIFRTEGISFLDYSKLCWFVNKNLKQVPGFVRCNIDAPPNKKFMDNINIEDYINKNPLEDTGKETEFELIPL